MGTLVTTCPATGHIIETGIESDQASMALTPRFQALIACPHCGSEHVFSKENTLVCERVDGIISYLSAA